MFSRNNANASNKTDRTRVDVAIIASVLAMGALNLVVMADQIGAGKAYAAVPCRCGAIAGVALA